MDSKDTSQESQQQQIRDSVLPSTVTAPARNRMETTPGAGGGMTEEAAARVPVLGRRGLELGEPSDNPTPSASNHPAPTNQVLDYSSEFDDDCNAKLDSGDMDPDSMDSDDSDHYTVTRAETDRPDPELDEDQIMEEDSTKERFTWSKNFLTFSGQREPFTAPQPGPSTNASSAYEIFTKIWDLETMAHIMEETNRYAWSFMLPKMHSDGGVDLPAHSGLGDWRDVTIPELYVFFALLILMSTDGRGRFGNFSEYWTTGYLEITIFKNSMSHARFRLIMRFLRFVDNDTISTVGPKNVLAKVKPLLDIMNEKFSSLYTPHEDISIYESLLLWTGIRPSSDSIRDMAAKIGIKTHGLYESTTGYLYRFIMHTGKSTEVGEDHLGFSSSSSKTVLKLMAGFFDKGYCLNMDNFYNSMPLTRYMKQRKTDVIGTLNRRRKMVPQIIKDMDEEEDVPRHTMISRHCGDISVIAWSDVEIITMVSTFHNADTAEGKRGYQMPLSVMKYNSCVCEVDNEDSVLSSACHRKRKRSHKWYISKLFRQLLNASISNSLVVYRHNNQAPVPIRDRTFRVQLADELLQRHLPAVTAPQASTSMADHILPMRLECAGAIPHFPKIATSTTVGANQRYRRRCVLCQMRKRNRLVSSYCGRCNVYLCIDPCYLEYHESPYL